jgi:hypothetical protein
MVPLVNNVDPSLAIIRSPSMAVARRLNERRGLPMSAIVWRLSVDSYPGALSHEIGRLNKEGSSRR